MDSSFKVKKSLNIQPLPTQGLSENGDIAVDTTLNKIQTRVNGVTDSVVQEATTQTLTNKTLTAPVISTISNSGTLTLPTGANTLATLAGAETFTNKTITAPAITTPRIDVVTLDGQASSPSNPSAGDYKLFVSDTTSKLTLRNSAGTETTVGSGSGGINYLSATGDAEAGITGWTSTAYTNGGLGGFPVAGYGFVSYSPNSTWNTSASSPLRGTSSFLYTKAAASAQGDLNYYTCAIDPADRGRQLSYNFDYTVVSGAYTDNDFCVAIYDVSNSKWIQPSGYKVSAVGTGTSATATGTFQTATNTASLNFCMFVLSSSTSAYSLKFDNLSLGPTVVPQSAAMSDWTSYTPTGSWVSNTTYTGKWRRVGDSMEIDAQALLSGAPTGSFTLNIPPGFTIDSTKISAGGTLSLYGAAYALDAATANYTGTVLYSSSTAVQVVGDGAAGSLYSATVPFTFGNLDKVTLRFTVPILGWSSNTIVSDSAATRVVAAKMYRNTSQTGINPNNSYVKINLDAVSSDTHGMANTGSNRIEIKVPGSYSFSWQVGIGGTNALNNQYASAIYKNGSLFAFGNSQFPVASGSFLLPGSTTDVAVTGDYYELYLFGQGNNSASTLASFTTATANFLTASMIQGPAQIQAATVVAAQYTGVPTGTLNGSANLMTIPTKEIDTAGVYASGIYTVPAPGIYLIAGSFSITCAASTVNQFVNIYIFKNGSSIAAYGNILATGMTEVDNTQGIYLANLIAGDQISLRSQTNVTSPVFAGGGKFTITRMSGVN